MEKSCYATGRGSPQSGRGGNDANVIFQMGGSRVLRSGQSTQSTQNYKEMNVCAESELLRSQSTDDLSGLGRRPAT
jgi:hypothetical protein